MRSSQHKPRILIHVDERRRDASVFLALAALFEQAGARAMLSSRRTTFSLLRNIPFEAALIAIPENIPYEAYPSIRSRTKIYILPPEGAIFEEKPLLVKFGGGTDSKDWDRHIPSITRYFLWGDYSRRILQGTGRFRDEQLVVAGAPRNDFFLAEPSPEEQAKADPTSLGAISDFILINSTDRNHLFKKIDQFRNIVWGYQSPNRNIEDRLWIEMAYFRTWLGFFDECQRRGRLVRLRIHQQEDPSAYRYLQAKYGPTLSLEGDALPFETWLDRVGVFLGCNSTAFFEAVAADKPSVNLTRLVGPRLAEHADQFRQSHYPILDHLFAPQTWEELFDFLKRIQQGAWGKTLRHAPEAQQVLRDVCAYPRSTSTLATVVRQVLEDLDFPSGPKRGVPRSNELLAIAHAKTLEFFSFRIRRDQVGNGWFPLQASRFRRQYAMEIARYLRAAYRFHPSEALFSQRDHISDPLPIAKEIP